MPGTRGSAGDTKKRSTRKGASSDAVDSNPGNNLTADPNTQTVALSVNGNWAAPPSIGQIEAALTGDGRAQHRILRIDMGADSAVVHVHPNDVAGCVGIVGTGNLQVRAEDAARPAARARPPPAPRAT